MTRNPAIIDVPSRGRRRFLAGGAAVAGAAALGFPAIHVRAQTPLKVGTYGGYFKDSFDEHIYPDFTSESGIAIESIAEPTGEAWLIQLETAARANVAPADVSMMAQTPRLKGQTAELWAALDESKLGNARHLQPHFVHRYDDGRVSGIGAVQLWVAKELTAHISGVGSVDYFGNPSVQRSISGMGSINAKGDRK